MKNLQEIKEKYAIEHGYDDWEKFINNQPNYKVETHMDEICIRAQKAYYIEQITELIEDLQGVHPEYILEKLQQEIEPTSEI